MGNLNASENGVKTRFTKDRQPNKKGRKPSKLKGVVKKCDYSNEDVRELFKNILFVFTKEDLEKLVRDKESPMILVGVSATLLDDIERGDADVIFQMLDRVYGKSNDAIPDAEPPIFIQDGLPE
jgi:hypothetical protein